MESGGIGFKTSNTTQSECVIKVREENITFYIVMSPGSYRFFKQVSQIACADRGDGIYSECSETAEFVPIVPKEMSYDWEAEIELVAANNSDGGISVPSPSFFDFFKSSIGSVIFWAIIVCIIIAAIIISFLLIRCLCARCQTRKDAT
jgi:hypothetical protein